MSKRRQQQQQQPVRESRAARKEREYRARMGELLETDPQPPLETVVDPGRGPDLPPGIERVLVDKNKLQQELRLLIKKPVMVSIDVLRGEWVYVVRGMKPPFSYWNGNKVLFYRSMDTSKNTSQ